MHRLTARKVETAAPGVHQDGRGLLLIVKASGGRSWVFRFMLNGRRRDLGLGGFPAVSLARARELAAEARALVAEKRDPLEERRQRRVVTFKDAAEALIQAKTPGWRSSKHAGQWRATLATYAFPKIGDRDVAAVDTAAVLDVLRTVWTRAPETGSRLRQRIEATLSYAAATGARSGANPARWRGHLDQLLAKPTKIKPVTHFRAMDWRELPTFWPRLQEQGGVAALALQFTILTAARSGETRGMVWGEVDGDLWTIPSNRMKAGREHRVPLTEPALAILERVAGLDAALVFPGRRGGRPLSDMSLTQLLRRMGLDVTAHGFRSSFRTWAGETTSHPREVIEHALAHQLPDRVEAAYARSDLLERRRVLMADWARFVTSPAGTVLELDAARRRERA